MGRREEGLKAISIGEYNFKREINKSSWEFICLLILHIHLVSLLTHSKLF